MQKKETNRAKQLPLDKQFQKGVKIIDVDTTIADYMSKVIIPNLEENGNIVNVPLIYGNAERWEGARKQGYLRDTRGRVQIPLVMFKRSTIQKNDSMPMFKEGGTMQYAKRYSEKNRYDRFSIMTGAKPSYELYTVSLPSYVSIQYEMMIWTSFTEHMNILVEAFQNASERYWGLVEGFKFKTSIQSFETTQEVTQGTERVIRTSFTATVNAYLLPEIVDNKPTMNKSFTPKRVVWGIETDLTGGSFSGVNVYNEYADVVNFIAIRGSQQAEFVNAHTVKLTNVKLPQLPPELVGVFDVENWFKVYINGAFISPGYYSYKFNGITKEIIFSFNNLTESEPGEPGGVNYDLDEDGVLEEIGFDIESNDEVLITGKFQEL